MTSLNIDEIKRYLPHRYPFLLVDRILEIKKEDSYYIKGIKNVTVNEPFFNGHFSKFPVMPGVLILEAMAQAAGILTFIKKGGYPSPDDLYFLAGTGEARFKKMVRPGDQLLLEADLLKERRELWKFACKATVDGQLVCQSEITMIKGK